MNEKNEIEKILITAPTSKAKQYCFVDWLQNTMAFSYPNFQIVLFDNSMDKGLYCDWMQNTFKELYGKNNHKFKAIYIPTNSPSVIERMTLSTEIMRKHAVTKNYRHILSLETDIFPESDIIENLLAHQKNIVGALYDRDEGIYRRLCIQKIVKEAPGSLQSMNFESVQEEIDFIDGSVKEVSSVGLGCLLINMNVLKNIPFRYVEGVHPDQFFSETMHMANEKIFADTSQIVKEHRNKEWGIFGRDFK